jgi:DNA-binding MarR family transcriptional regulator
LTDPDRTEPHRTDPHRTANVLGALAGTVTDQATAAMLAAAGLPAKGSSSAPAALSAIAEFLGTPTVEQIRQVLGLTPSGAVRLIDRLAADGLVTRAPGTDGRSRAISLTDRGTAAAAALAQARRDVLATMLDGFSADELDTLHGLLGRMMRNAVNAKSGGAWICRMCDLTACGRGRGDCPAAAAAMDRYAVSATDAGIDESGNRR